jgi:integrase
MLQKLTANEENSSKTKALVQSNRDVALMLPGRWRVAGETGLYLYVSPDGQVRRWLFRFTSPVTKRVTEAGLDLAPAVSLADAKGKAADLRRQIANGVDPIHAKRAKKANATTFKEVAQQWITVHQSSWKGGDSGRQIRNATLLLYRHGAAIANKPVSAITSDMIQDALAKLWARVPNQGRKTLGMIERVLDYARAKGMRNGDNPAAWRGCFEYRFAKVKSVDRGHHAALPYEEMPAFMEALRKRQDRSVGALCLEFCILTCARSGEGFGAKWEEIDFDKSIWTVPAERMKGGRKHEVPLSNRALEILSLQRQHSVVTNATSSFVFTGYNRKQMAERNMRSVLYYMKVKASVHGFRSTFRDWCGDTTHYPREHVEGCLAHRVGNSVELAYRRQTALEKRREILAAWAEYCAARL